MPAVIEEVGALADAALVIAPALADVPVLGRLIILLAHGHGDETKALEKLQEAAKKKETDRATRRKRNSRYVLKASDAMQCVEDHLMNDSFLLLIAKGLFNVIFKGGAAGGSAVDLMADRIYTCIEEKVLRQDTPRSSHRTTTYGRPARGHGHGRTLKKS